MALSKYKIFILSIFPFLGLWILWEVFERPERVYKNWKTEWLPKRFGNTGKFLARVFWFFMGSLMTLLGLFFWYAVLTHKI